MHNLKVNSNKALNTCKLHSDELVNELGNVQRRGTKPQFSDSEVIALSMTSEALSIDSENLLFSKLRTDYKNDFPTLISRRQYNDRRKNCFILQKEMRERIARSIDVDEDIYTIDSKPFQVCKLSRMNRCKVGKNDFETAPDFGYCASKDTWY